jgi:hypothetical protein
MCQRGVFGEEIAFMNKLRTYCIRGMIYAVQFTVFDNLLTLEWITAASRPYLIANLSSLYFL